MNRPSFVYAVCVCGSADLGTGVFPVGDETNLHPTLCGVEEWLGVLAVSLPWLDLRALLKSGVLAYYARRHSLDPRFERPFVSSDMRVVLSQTGGILPLVSVFFCLVKLNRFVGRLTYTLYYYTVHAIYPTDVHFTHTHFTDVFLGIPLSSFSSSFQSSLAGT